MAVAITGAPDGWYEGNIVFSKRVGKTCTYTYKLGSRVTAGDNPRRAEKMRMVVTQYNNGRIIHTTDVMLSLNGTGSFNLVQGCTRFFFRFQLNNSKGGGAVWENWQDVTAPPTVPASNLTLSFDSTKTGNNLSYGFTGFYNKDSVYRNQPRSGYKISVLKEQSISGKYSSSNAVSPTSVLGWDTNETVSWSSATAATLPSADADWVKYTFTVEVLGWRNNPPSGAKTVKRLFIARPPIPTITKFTKSSNGKGADVSVKYNLAYKDGVMSRPMDKLKLQIAYAADGGTIKESDWTDIGEEQEAVIRSGDVTAGFYISDADISPSQGQHVYLRAKASWQTLTPTYSKNFLVPDQYYFRKVFTYEDSAPATDISITSVTTGDDNTSLVAIIGYNDITTYNACELGYSTDKNAWMSTKQPETFEMPDADWKTSTSLVTSHKYTSKVKISGLDEETTYYLRARRYNTDDATKKTAWSIVKEGNTGGEELTGLVLTASDIVVTGKSCTFSWNFPDDLKQTEWFLKDPTTQGVLASGTGSVTSVSITYDTAGTKQAYLTSYFDNGKSMDAEAVSVEVVDPPTVSWTTEPSATVTALPLTFGVKADDTSADVRVVVTSLGMHANTPEGWSTQYAGDVVYSAIGTGSGVSCSIDNSTYNRLWDGGVYMVYATATANNVTSSPLTKIFTVSLADTVELPADDDVVITPLEDKSATIQVNNLADGITWDLYRATTDSRNSLVASGQASGATVTDNYAPYSTSSKCKYIVLVRNANRQFAFRDYEYEAKHKVLRFDWNDNYVEHPYNIEISDETDKQFEQQVYLDGSQKGAWGASVIRSTSLSTDTVYVKDEEVQKKVRELARYQGAVFVRTPLGQAYTANVEVSDINKTYDKKAMAVSFDCTEIDLTSDFIATPPSTETA